MRKGIEGGREGGRTGQIDVDDIAEGVLGVLGDTNGTGGAVDLEPLVGLGVAAVSGVGYSGVSRRRAEAHQREGLRTSWRVSKLKPQRPATEASGTAKANKSDEEKQKGEREMRGREESEDKGEGKS